MFSATSRQMSRLVFWGSIGGTMASASVTIGSIGPKIPEIPTESEKVRHLLSQGSVYVDEHGVRNEPYPGTQYKTDFTVLGKDVFVDKRMPSDPIQIKVLGAVLRGMPSAVSDATVLTRHGVITTVGQVDPARYVHLKACPGGPHPVFVEQCLAYYLMPSSVIRNLAASTPTPQPSAPIAPQSTEYRFLDDQSQYRHWV